MHLGLPASHSEKAFRRAGSVFDLYTPLGIPLKSRGPLDEHAIQICANWDRQTRGISSHESVTAVRSVDVQDPAKNDHEFESSSILISAITKSTLLDVQ